MGTFPCVPVILRLMYDLTGDTPGSGTTGTSQPWWKPAAWPGQPCPEAQPSLKISSELILCNMSTK
eukprot:3484330-Amphidinium_carterae.1